MLKDVTPRRRRKMFGIVSKAMVILGVLAILGAAGNDDLYGGAYPLSEMALTLLIGLALMAGGYKMHEIAERRRK